MEHGLPIVIAVLSFWAAVVYLIKGHPLPSLYWFSAFLLNVSVIGMAMMKGNV